MSEAAAAPVGALSMDAAVSLLSAPEAPPEEQAPEAQSLDTESEPPPTGDDAASEAEEPGDGDDAGDAEAEAEPVDAPQWWDAEDKAAFAKLSPELQAIVVKQEGKREAITAKEKDQARQARQKAETELTQLAPLRQALEQIVPQAQQIFADKWAGYTDLALAQHAQLGPDEAIQAMQWKAARDAEASELHRLRTVQEATQQQAYQQFLERETARLPEVAPDLADPVKGPERKQALAKFLVEQGIPENDLNHASARQLALAYDAMRYRQLASSAKQQMAPKTLTPSPARPGLKPAAASAPSKSTEVARLTNRLSQTRSMDDAVALMIQKGL